MDILTSLLEAVRSSPEDMVLRSVYADALEDVGRDRKEAFTFKVCWYVQIQRHPLLPRNPRVDLFSIEIPTIVGRHYVQIVDETDATQRPHSFIHVDVSRWSHGWIVRPYFPEYTFDIQDDQGGWNTIPESCGYRWMLTDNQQRGFCWLDFDKEGTGSLSHLYNLTTSDGTFVSTGCGDQIDPKYRHGVNSPEEALTVEWFANQGK